MANKSLPNDTITIERILFSRDQKHRVTWRMVLRDALKRTRSGYVVPDEPPLDKPPTKPLPASNIPIRVPTHFMGRDKNARGTRKTMIVALRALRRNPPIARAGKTPSASPSLRKRCRSVTSLTQQLREASNFRGSH